MSKRSKITDSQSRYGSKSKMKDQGRTSGVTPSNAKTSVRNSSGKK
jgi:hypothetical protein